MTTTTLPALRRHPAYTSDDVDDAIARARRLAGDEFYGVRNRTLRFDVKALANEIFAYQRLVDELERIAGTTGPFTRHPSYTLGDVHGAIDRARALASESYYGVPTRVLNFDVKALANEVISYRNTVNALRRTIAAR